MVDDARREPLRRDRHDGRHEDATPPSRTGDDAWWDPDTGRPTPLAIAAWVENPASCPDAEAIERHVRQCAACREEADLARAFFDETAAPPIAPADLAWIRSHERRPLVAPMADGGGDLSAGGLTSLDPKLPARTRSFDAPRTPARKPSVTRRRRVIEIGLATTSGLAAALVLMLSGQGDLEVSPIGAATSPTYRGAAERGAVESGAQPGATNPGAMDAGAISAPTSHDDRTSDSYDAPVRTQRRTDDSGDASNGLETPAGSPAAAPIPDGGDSDRR